MNPLISVIIPIYNVEKYLARCVDSIVNQTYKNLEIILVDDGSPDRCPQMCDDYVEKDSRIKVVHKNNGGLSDARNTGIAVATGEYISFIDSDDWIDLETYDLVLEKMLATNSQIGAFNLKSVSDSNFKTEYNENYIVGQRDNEFIIYKFGSDTIKVFSTEIEMEQELNRLGQSITLKPQNEY